VGTKSNELEESTKIRSSAEIDEMLRAAGVSPSVPSDDDYDDFDAHTQIGNVQELAARSMSIEDEPAIIPRASSNVIRRTTSPHVVARSTKDLPAVMPMSSNSELPLPAPPKTDDDAFAPWEDQFEEQLEATPIVEMPEPSTLVGTPPPPIKPSIIVEEAPVPIVLAAPTPSKLRWGIVAWVVLLLVTISVSTLGYMRITQLEQELASAKAQLKQ
jgi:hypothetical protein